jgi:LemA protein
LEFILGAVVIGGIVAFGWYASLISRRNRALEALSSIDVQLRQRFDLIPNVLKLAQKYMDHERDLLSTNTDLRNKVQAPYNRGKADEVAQHLDASRALESGMGRIFALAENYPDLKADSTIIRAQETYEEVEGHISAARRFYNAAVGDLNNAVQIFPGTLIAGLANVQAMPFYELDDPEARKPISVDDVMR